MVSPSGFILALCSTGNTHDISVEARNSPWTRVLQLLGRVSTPDGGSNEFYLSDYVRATIGCHGHLRSACNASWPLHCRAGKF